MADLAILKAKDLWKEAMQRWKKYKLNTSLHETTKATPYQLCFGQPPHSSSFPGATTGSIMEEAVSDILDDIEEEVTDISGMAGCTKEDVSAAGIFEKGGSDDSDSDTKQNETDTAQCISKKEKHMSEVEDDFYASHEDMELFEQPYQSGNGSIEGACTM
ncbi:hypothetical protein EMCRGX_G007137 [Ephydatia muelleri]